MARNLDWHDWEMSRHSGNFCVAVNLFIIRRLSWKFVLRNRDATFLRLQTPPSFAATLCQPATTRKPATAGWNPQKNSIHYFILILTVLFKGIFIRAPSLLHEDFISNVFELIKQGVHWSNKNWKATSIEAGVQPMCANLTHKSRKKTFGVSNTTTNGLVRSKVIYLKRNILSSNI